jgi:hypothetical protein
VLCVASVCVLCNFASSDSFSFICCIYTIVPRAFLADFLRACSRHGLGVTLDVHTYPGGTSIGTFSGVYPRWPRFWTHGDKPGTMDVGRTLFQQLLDWCESLAIQDPQAFKGLRAISPMNEPAHLAGLFSGDPPQVTNQPSFLPDLPSDIAHAYWEELHSSSNHDTSTLVPKGPHLRVLLWLRDSVEAFRNSNLPGLGKELHVNIHESIFSPSVLPKGDGQDPGGRHPGATRIVAAWWSRSTTQQERADWAVLDMHHYHAWEPSCTGTVDGPNKGNYTCGDISNRDNTLKRCASWATMFRQVINEECGILGNGDDNTGRAARLISGEFSASTHHSVRHACNDVGTLKASYLYQVQAAQQANIELFYWSFKMPAGGAFRKAWSFSHFLYTMGILPHPDTSDFGCNDHIPDSDEPTDDP